MRFSITYAVLLSVLFLFNTSDGLAQSMTLIKAWETDTTLTTLEQMLFMCRASMAGPPPKIPKALLPN